MDAVVVAVTPRKPPPRMALARLSDAGESVRVVFDRASSQTLGLSGGRSAPCDTVFEDALALLGVGAVCRWASPTELVVALGYVRRTRDVASLVMAASFGRLPVARGASVFRTLCNVWYRTCFRIPFAPCAL